MKANNNDRWWCYGVTKGPTKNDFLLVYRYDCNLLENLLGVTLKYNDDYIRWIPFDKFKNIEYLTKGGFGEVHEATWIDGSQDYGDQEVVLERIHNSNDKIVDILKEVKQCLLLSLPLL